jgi:hypothetical protein
MIATRLLVPLLLLTLVVCSTGAAYVNVVEPSNYTVYSGSTVYLGKVGPGQTFTVTISTTTANNTGALVERGWNQLVVSSLPQGWIAANSSLNNAYESVQITPASTAPNGTYQFILTAINTGNYSKLGSVKFTAFINVTTNVFRLQVSPTSISTGPGEPAKILVSINNSGVSDSPFLITATGLPAWNNTIPVIALHGTTGNFTYPVFENEPGTYYAQLIVSSQQSPLVYERSNITLTVQASLLNDYKAIGQGSIAFPVIYEPVYAVMYLISLLFNS